MCVWAAATVCDARRSRRALVFFARRECFVFSRPGLAKREAIKNCGLGTAQTARALTLPPLHASLCTQRTAQPAHMRPPPLRAAGAGRQPPPAAHRAPAARSAPRPTLTASAATTPDPPVPATHAQAFTCFAAHPTPRLIVGGLASVAAARVALAPPVGAADVAGERECVCVCEGWCAACLRENRACGEGLVCCVSREKRVDRPASRTHIFPPLPHTHSTRRSMALLVCPGARPPPPRSALGLGLVWTCNS